MAKILSIFNLSQFTDQSLWLKNIMSNRKMFHPLLLVHSKYVFNVILVVVTTLAITFTKCWPKLVICCNDKLSISTV